MALALTLAVCASPATACGFEDSALVSLGALNFAYPDALHVGTAAWQAERAGLLRRAEAAPAAAQWQALRQLHELTRRAGARGVALPGNTAIVLLPAVFWSRLTVGPNAGAPGLSPHVAGPEPDDHVLVTTAEALAAWLEGRLGAGELEARGLLRYYGAAAELTALRSALAQLDAPPEVR